MGEPKITIIINQRPHHFDKTTLEPHEFREKVGAPSDYEVWQIVKDPDPEGQLPLDDVQITGPTAIKSGERFRVVPPGTFGVWPSPAQLVEEVDGLRQEGHTIELVEAEGWAIMIFQQYGVPSGYSKSRTQLLLKFPLSYPNGRPDMFWTDEDLILGDKRQPKSAENIESTLGRQWRRFSWHPTNWNPARDNVRTYLEFVNNRLAKSV